MMPRNLDRVETEAGPDVNNPSGSVALLNRLTSSVQSGQPESPGCARRDCRYMTSREVGSGRPTVWNAGRVSTLWRTILTGDARGRQSRGCIYAHCFMSELSRICFEGLNVSSWCCCVLQPLGATVPHLIGLIPVRTLTTTYIL